MEDFPKGSEKFLKKPSDFQEISDLGEPANDVIHDKLLPQDILVFENIAGKIKRGEITKADAFLMVTGISEKMTKEDAFLMLTGISKSFFEIHNSAMLIRDRLNAQTIQGFMREYGEWTREDLLQFVNSTKNQLQLQKRPALTIALYELLERSTL